VGHVLSTPYAELYEEFLEFERRRMSSRSFPALQTESYALLKWLEHEYILPEEVTVQHVLQYKSVVANRVTRNGKPVAAGTCCNAIKTGKRLFRYMVTSGKRESNPFMAVRYPRIPDRIHRNVLTEAQMNALLIRLRIFNSVGSYRIHVIAELLYAAGLRIAEAASLLPRDIDTRQRSVYVREGKGGKGRTAFLTGYAAEVLEHYIARGREQVLQSYCGPRSYEHTLFCVGFSMLQHEINNALRIACTGLELPVITSHGFRHSLGTHLLRAGCDMRHIQVILGHDDLRSTQVYTHVNKDDVKASLDTHHPRKWSSTTLNTPGGTP